MRHIFISSLLLTLVFAGCHTPSEEPQPDKFYVNHTALPCPLCHKLPYVAKFWQEPDARRGLHLPPGADPRWLYNIGCQTKHCMVSCGICNVWFEDEAVEIWNNRVCSCLEIMK